MMKILLPLVSLVALTNAVFQDLNFNTNSSIAVYWGQSTKGQVQRELSYYCGSDAVDIIILSFLSEFGKDYNPQGRDGYTLNIADQCSLSIDGDYTCPRIGRDIKQCQDMGKRVLLSLGGEQGKKQTYGFSDEEEGQDFAKVLWNAFGEGFDGTNRPFGDAVLDGFDIDAENNDETGYVSLVNELKSLSQAVTKKFYYTAAPECTFVDMNLTRLVTEVDLDYIFVQFYNNECNLRNLEDFNYDVWSELVGKKSPTNTKIFVGLPSSRESASKGFVENPDLIKERITELSFTRQWREHFGGLMFWDASKGLDDDIIDSEDSYIHKVWATLDGDAVIESGASVSSSSPKSKPTPKIYQPNEGANMYETPSKISLVISLAIVLLA